MKVKQISYTSRTFAHQTQICRIMIRIVIFRVLIQSVKRIHLVICFTKNVHENKSKTHKDTKLYTSSATKVTFKIQN